MHQDSRTSHREVNYCTWCFSGPGSAWTRPSLSPSALPPVLLNLCACCLRPEKLDVSNWFAHPSLKSINLCFHVKFHSILAFLNSYNFYNVRVQVLILYLYHTVFSIKMYRFLMVCPKFYIFPYVLLFFLEDRLFRNALPCSRTQFGEVKEKYKYSEGVSSVPFRSHRRVLA